MTTPSSHQDVQALRRGGLAIGFIPHLGLIQANGPDALTFLQNRTTNDVLSLQIGEGHVNTILNRSAHIQSAFTLHRQAESLWLLLDRTQIPHTLAELEKYHIMEQLTLSDVSDQVALIACQGSPALELLLSGCMEDPSLAETLQKIPGYGLTEGDLFGESVLIYQYNLTGESGFILQAGLDAADVLLIKLREAAQENGLSTLDITPDFLETTRIEAGIPKMGVDMNIETLLPETGLEQTAVSYTKGCYLGQETVARVKTYGAVQKALMGLKFQPNAQLPASEQEISLDGKTVGILKSITTSPTLECPIALAYLAKDCRTPDKSLTVEIGDTSYDVTVTLLPFYTPVTASDEARQLYDQGLQQFAQANGKEAEEAAVHTLRAAIEKDPLLADAYESLGVILSRQERYEEAIALMHRLLEVDPNRIMAHTNLSIYYMKLGDKERAEDEKAKATMLAFQQKMAEKGQTVDPEAERRKKEESTRNRIQLFKDALQYNPEDSLGNFGLGTAHLELEEYEDAIPAFEKTIVAQPTHSVAYLSLGKCLQALDRLEEAKAIYQKGIDVAATRRDLMPLQEMQQRLNTL
ncbi:MAG: tetratricopeptide repeat protein [Vampirovibrio sp.]|nr:tetratricopeptide repeat protein [Vampirovibrio sp.]